MSAVFGGTLYTRGRISRVVTEWELEEAIQWGEFYAAMDRGAL